MSGWLGPVVRERAVPRRDYSETGVEMTIIKGKVNRRFGEGPPDNFATARDQECD